MFGLILALAGAVLLSLVTIVVLLVLGMKVKSPIARAFFIWFTRTIANPRVMRTAGTAGVSAGVIRHSGRTSGRAYETPMEPIKVADRFVIALPYGSQTNWVQNVLASGSATIVHDGQTYAVDQPEIVPVSAVETCFSASSLRSMRVFGVDDCLRVRITAAEAAA
jgi:hypothetical protein